MATTGTPRRAAPARPPAPRHGKAGGPPTGRNGRRPSKGASLWRRIVLFFQIVTFFVLIIVIAALVYLFVQMQQPLSTIDLKFAPPGRTYIYSSDGVLLADIYQYNRQVVPITRIPQYLQDATVAFEDKRFYQHQGVDFQGIARSILTNIESGDLKAQGGSTITQQLARNMHVDGLTRKKTIQRKLKEWIVANQIEKSYTKQQILGMYLNWVNYGSGAYGVQAASETYFGKDVSKCDLAQCALLAGLPNRPSGYDPYRDKTAALAQRGRVLQEMLAQHFITSAQFVQATAEPIRLAFARPPSQGSRIFHAPYFTDYVISQLNALYGEDTVLAGNMKVYTTINMKMQDLAEQDLEQGIAAHAGPGGPTQGCLVALDPKTGDIKAMVGGVDYQKSQFNIAANGRRQPGSSFKAVLYSAAIDSGAVTEDTTVMDAPQTYRMSNGQAYTPKDDTYYSYRRMNLREAMAYSVNTIAVKVLAHIGPALEIQYARRLGVESPLAPVLSLALGSSAVTPLEMAGVYETFPDGGNHAIPTAWTEVDDANGKHVLAPQVETQVLQKSTVSQLDDMLRAVVTDPGGTGHNVEALVPDARGKTGTTQEHKDVWFDGYTPNLVCVVWAGHPIYHRLHNGTFQAGYGEPMSGNSWGATVCAPIWAKFISEAEPVFLQDQARERARALAQRGPKPKPVAHNPVPVAVKPVPAERHSGPVPETDQDNSEPVDSQDSSTAPSGDANDTDDMGDTGNSNQNHAPLPGNAPPAASSAPDSPGPAAPLTPTPTVSPPSAPVDVVPVVPVPRRRASVSVQTQPVTVPEPRKPQMVTVRINPEDGLLATQWDPEVVVRTYVKGTEPRRYSRLHPPPPGEP
jgi:1A family penicillin-binding protein